MMTGGLFRLGERYRGKRVFSPYWILLNTKLFFCFSSLHHLSSARNNDHTFKGCKEEKQNFQLKFSKQKERRGNEEKQEKKGLRGGGTFIYDSSKSCPNLFALLHPVFDVLTSSKFYFIFCFFSSSGCFIILFVSFFFSLNSFS